MARVLVVDDDPDIELSSLRAGDSRSRGARRGERIAGLEVCRVASPDLVLVDMNMPVMGGLEMIRTLRTTSSGIELPVVMLSAMGELEGRDAAIAAGAVDCISEPLTSPIWWPVWSCNCEPKRSWPRADRRQPSERLARTPRSSARCGGLHSIDPRTQGAGNHVVAAHHIDSRPVGPGSLPRG